MAEISKEYAAALFMLACEENAKKEYVSALEEVKAAFSENMEYSEFLASPAIALSQRLSSIETAFSGKVPENILSFLLLLCEKGRISCLMEAVEEFFALVDASEHIVCAKAVSALELTEDEKKKLQDKLETLYKGKVDIEYSIDESLLGGLVVEVDGKVFDGSLRHRLHEVKEVMKI